MHHPMPGSPCGWGTELWVVGVGEDDIEDAAPKHRGGELDDRLFVRFCSQELKELLG